MMTLILVLLLVSMAALAWNLLIRQRRRQLNARPAASEERHLFNLRVGDIVQFGSSDWVIEDRLLYEETDGFQWLEYRLQDGADRRWLSISEDDDLEVGWFRSLSAEEGPRNLERRSEVPAQVLWQWQLYRLQAQGEAQVRSQSRTLNRQSDRCTYGEYKAPDGAMLVIEWWGHPSDPLSEIEVAEGTLIDPVGLTLLAGDGRSIYRPEGLPVRQDPPQDLYT